MAKTNPAQFVREVRNEMRKVHWSSRKETGISTLLVFVMVSIMGIFFLLVDQIISWGVQSLIK